jgi:hypothetical protein
MSPSRVSSGCPLDLGPRFDRLIATAQGHQLAGIGPLTPFDCVAAMICAAKPDTFSGQIDG